LKYSPQPLGSEPLRDLDRGDPPFVDVQHDLRDELGRDMRLGEDELLDQFGPRQWTAWSSPPELAESRGDH
jgi:hypothetical protein